MDWKLEDQLEDIILPLNSKQLSPWPSKQSLGPTCDVFSMRQHKTRVPWRWSLPSPGTDTCSSSLQKATTFSSSCEFQKGSIPRRLDRGLRKKGLLTENMFQYNQENTTDKSTACRIAGSPSTSIYQLLDLRQVIQPPCTSTFLTVKWGQKTTFFRM